VPQVTDVTQLAASGRAAALLDRRNFAVLASHGRSGPHQAVLWVLREDDRLLFSSVEGRVTVRNLRRDPRASVIVYDIADPEEYVAARGRIEILPDPLRELSNRMSHKYTGRDHVESDESAVRVLLRLHPEDAIHRCR
jgi:PPOX class probable F420-dependent enzyme